MTTTLVESLPEEKQEIWARVTDLEKALNVTVLERPVESKTAVIALLSRKHHFQLGPPGTAKSYLVRQLFKLIEGLNADDLFQLLLTNYTTPEELCGIPSFKAMENDEYKRNTAFKLPEAKIAFLDEIFKGSSSILNTLLTLLNERLFYNGASPILVPLEVVFSASNEPPKGDELHALWDRLHFRHEVKPLQTKANFVKMLKIAQQPQHEPVIHWDELQEAQKLVGEVEIPTLIYNTLCDLREKLIAKNIEVTDRRFSETLPIIQATAFMNGRVVADIRDLRLLQHVLWSRAEQMNDVGQEVIHLSNPIDQKADEILKNLVHAMAKVDEEVSNKDATSGRALAKITVEAHGKLKRATEEYEALKVEAVEAGAEDSEDLQLLAAKITETRIQLLQVFKDTKISPKKVED